MLIWIKNRFPSIVLILIYNKKDSITEIIRMAKILIFKKEDLVTKMALILIFNKEDLKMKAIKKMLTKVDAILVPLLIIIQKIVHKEIID